MIASTDTSFYNCRLVGDMPFGTYEFADTDRALENAYRFVKEAGMDAIKIEVRGRSALNVDACRAVGKHYTFLRNPLTSLVAGW